MKSIYFPKDVDRWLDDKFGRGEISKYITELVRREMSEDPEIIAAEIEALQERVAQAKERMKTASEKPKAARVAGMSEEAREDAINTLIEELNRKEKEEHRAALIEGPHYKNIMKEVGINAIELLYQAKLRRESA